MTIQTVEELFKTGAHEQCIAKFETLQPAGYSDYELYWTAKSVRALKSPKAALEFLGTEAENSAKLRRLKIQLFADCANYSSIIDEVVAVANKFPDHGLDFTFFAFRELVEHLQFSLAIELLDAVTLAFPTVMHAHMSEISERRDLCLRHINSLKMHQLPGHLAKGINEVKFIDIGDLPEISCKSLSETNQHPPIAKLLIDANCTSSAPSKSKTTAEYIFSDGRKKKAPALPQQKDAFILSFDKASLHINNKAAFIAGAENRIIRDISSPVEALSYAQSIAECQSAEDFQCAIAIPPLNDTGYFNFILNGLGTILVRQKLDIQWPVYCPYHDFKLFRRGVADLFPHVPFAYPAPTTRKVCFDRLIVPFTEGRNLSAQTVQMFQAWSQSFDSHSPEQTKIYISRSLAKNRRLVNEIEIEEIVSRWGFKIVHLEKLNFSEQISLFSSAEYIIAPHGAGLTNLVFCNNLRCLIEIMPDSYHVRGFENMCQLLGANYVGVFGNSNTKGFDSPWNVSKSLVEEAITTHGPLFDWI